MIAEELVPIPHATGALDGRLAYDEDREPEFLALVCPPHPLLGGTRDNPVVAALLLGLAEAGGVALTWEYAVSRTVTSTREALARRADFWEHPAAGAGYRSELLEAEACLHWLRSGGFVPVVSPALLAGYSYGGALALLAAAADSAVLAVAPPLGALPVGGGVVSRDQSLLIPGEDVASTDDVVDAYVASHRASIRLIARLDGDDHFLLRSLGRVKELAREWAGLRGRGSKENLRF